jgi:hypothetical protein
MTDHVAADLPALAAGGAHLFEAGEALGDLLAGTRTTLVSATAARPWGSDEIGSAFDAGYRPAEQGVLAAFEAMARRVRALGEQVEAVAAELQETDREAGVRVTRAYRDPT